MRTLQGDYRILPSKNWKGPGFFDDPLLSRRILKQHQTRPRDLRDLPSWRYRQVPSIVLQERQFCPTPSSRSPLPKVSTSQSREAITGHSKLKTFGGFHSHGGSHGYPNSWMVYGTCPSKTGMIWGYHTMTSETIVFHLSSD